MDRLETVVELENIIGEYLKAQGLELVELLLRHEGQGLILRILVDRPQGGITLDECTRLNIQVSNLLDEKDILQSRYILEVSSPGLDRPLKAKNDFVRCVGRKVRLFLNEAVKDKLELEGTINKIEGDSVYFERNGEVIEIALTKINKAKQVID